jgi:hypothetical protein
MRVTRGTALCFLKGLENLNRTPLSSCACHFGKLLENGSSDQLALSFGVFGGTGIEHRWVLYYLSHTPVFFFRGVGYLPLPNIFLFSVSLFSWPCFLLDFLPSSLPIASLPSFLPSSLLLLFLSFLSLPFL